MGVATAGYPTTPWTGVSATRTDPKVDRAPDFADWDRAVAEVKAVQEALDDRDTFTAPNAVGGAFPVGEVAYLLANGTGAAKADANGADPLPQAVGLVAVGTGGSGGTVTIRKGGELELTTAQWDAAAGTTGGLTPYVEYYVSGATAGKLTPTRPSTSGDHVIVAIVAKSATKALVVMRPIEVVA